MREGDRAVNLHTVADPKAPHGARKVAEAVGGQQERMLEGRNEKCTRQMSLVVLDTVKLRANLFGIGIKYCGQCFWNTSKSRENFDAFTRKGRHAQRVKKLCAQPGVRISRHGDMVDVRECEARF